MEVFFDRKPQQNKSMKFECYNGEDNTIIIVPANFTDALKFFLAMHDVPFDVIDWKNIDNEMDKCYIPDHGSFHWKKESPGDAYFYPIKPLKYLEINFRIS